MSWVNRWIKNHRLATFIILAYAISWAIFPLVLISQALGIFGLFGPMAAAIIVTGIADGRVGVSHLMGRLLQARERLIWYLVALGLPFVLSVVITGASLVFGSGGNIQLQPVSALSLAIFLLVFGEEVGWRGYALPALQERRSAFTSSLILGTGWAFWHLPTFFLPGMPQAGIPFAAFWLTLIGLAMLMTWVYLHTHGSLLIATIFHGAYNTLGLINPALDPATHWWLYALVYGVTAACVLAVYGRNLSQQHAAKPQKVVA